MTQIIDSAPIFPVKPYCVLWFFIKFVRLKIGDFSVEANRFLNAYRFVLNPFGHKLYTAIRRLHDTFNQEDHKFL